MEMESISRETIKPSLPTPSNLTIYPLSLIDNIVAPNSVPLLYFYQNQSRREHDNNTDDEEEGSKILLTLKKSLSKVLSTYYPLAGRLQDKLLSIHCNDQGVSLLVTRINSNLSSFLHNDKEASLNSLFPDELQWEDMRSSASLVAIQINRFACGGIAISVCMSHKVGDVSVLFNFINDWALLNRKYSELKQEEDDDDEEEEEESRRGSPFPQGDFPVLPEFVFLKQNTVCRRLVFEGSKIESLKATVSSSNKVENPTRVEVVIALIYKCAASALGLNANNTPLRVAVNLRKRMVPPLPEKYLGNLVWSFRASKQRESTVTELHDLVSKMREGLYDFCDKYVKKFGDLSCVFEFLKQATSFLPKEKQGGVAASTSVLTPDEEKKISSFLFVSWCRFRTYEADFGWGKPIWVTTCGCPVRNTVVLMDTGDGDGIEAIVNMEEKDMIRFERDVELVQYASLNPNQTHVGLDNVL